MTIKNIDFSCVEIVCNSSVVVVVHWFCSPPIDHAISSLSRYSFFEDFHSLLKLRSTYAHNAIVAQRANKRERERKREQSVMVRRWFVEGAKLIQGWERHSFRPTKMSSKSGMPGKTGVTKRPAGIRGPWDSEEAKKRDEAEEERKVGWVGEKVETRILRNQ